MYNIALCFYGEARNWQIGAESIKKFRNLSKKRFSIDVYCHLWDNITLRTRNIKQLIENKADLNKCIISSNLQHDELLASYEPVNYKIENKEVLDFYVDKFNPRDDVMSTEDFKLAIKYSNTPCFSQLYSTAQSFNIVQNKDKYDLIIIMRTDCLFDDNSITERTIRYFCKTIKNKNHLLVERMSFVPLKNEPWLYTGYMLGNSNVFRSLFEEFPKIPIGMGQYRRDVYSYRGEIHAEIANYILNHTNIGRVWPILARGHPKFVGEYKQFNIERF